MAAWTACSNSSLGAAVAVLGVGGGTKFAGGVAAAARLGATLAGSAGRLAPSALKTAS